MSLRSMLASVFVVLLVLSVKNSLQKLRASPKDFSGPKISPSEPLPSGPHLCIPCESRVFSFKEKTSVRMESTERRREIIMAAKGLPLSSYPIDTLDPPSLKETGRLPTARIQCGLFLGK